LVDTEESSLDSLSQLLDTAGFISPEVMEEKAMKRHREELEELIDRVYLDMEMNPSRDLT
jgi:DNA-binding FadR family transcriptional regulator